MRKKKLCLPLISCGVSEQKRYGGQRLYDGINLDKNEVGLVVYHSQDKKSKILTNTYTHQSPHLNLAMDHLKWILFLAF